jgi:hypothetical protein
VPTRRAPSFAAVAIVTIGAALHTSVAAHAALRAQNALEFLHYAVRCLSWPWLTQVWLGPLLWAPWFLLLIERLRRPARLPSGPSPDFLLAAGLGVLIQIAAVSFSRAGSGEPPASRYGDVFAIGLIVSASALAFVTPQFRRGRLVALGWIVLAGVCLAFAGRDAWRTSLPGSFG